MEGEGKGSSDHLGTIGLLTELSNGTEVACGVLSSVMAWWNLTTRAREESGQRGSSQQGIEERRWGTSVAPVLL